MDRLVFPESVASWDTLHCPRDNTCLEDALSERPCDVHRRRPSFQCEGAPGILRPEVPQRTDFASVFQPLEEYLEAYEVSDKIAWSNGVSTARQLREGRGVMKGTADGDEKP